MAEEAASSPPAENANVTIVGGEVPSVTSTISGLPISPVYAGVGPSFKPFSASRRAHFTRGVAGASPHIPEISYDSNYIPQRRGDQSVVAKEKDMIGDGEQHQDPLDEFKPQGFREGNTETDDKPTQVEKEYRHAGKRAYKSENRGNRELPYHRQVRYTQS